MVNRKRKKALKQFVGLKYDASREVYLLTERYFSVISTILEVGVLLGQ